MAIKRIKGKGDAVMKKVCGWWVPDDDKKLWRALKRQFNANPDEKNFTGGLKRSDEWLSTNDDKKFNRVIQYSKSFDTAIDVGAHVGLWSVSLSKMFKEVHAFEIMPEVRECLKRNIKERGINNIIVHEFGLGGKPGSININYSPSDGFSTHVCSPNEQIDPSNMQIEVPIVTLDELSLKKVSLIKMDVEGFEYFVLSGGINTILDNKPIMLMEEKGHSLRYDLDRYAATKLLTKNDGIIITKYPKEVIIGWDDKKCNSDDKRLWMTINDKIVKERNNKANVKINFEEISKYLDACIYSMSPININKSPHSPYGHLASLMIFKHVRMRVSEDYYEQTNPIALRLSSDVIKENISRISIKNKYYINSKSKVRLSRKDCKRISQKMTSYILNELKM